MPKLDDFNLLVLDGLNNDNEINPASATSFPSTVTSNCSGLFQTEGFKTCPSNMFNCDEC